MKGFISLYCSKGRIVSIRRFGSKFERKNVIKTWKKIYQKKINGCFIHVTFDGLGKRDDNKKLYHHEVIEVIEMLKNGRTGSEIAEKYSISKSTIRDIRLRKYWYKIFAT